MKFMSHVVLKRTTAALLLAVSLMFVGCSKGPEPTAQPAGQSAAAVDPLPSWNDGPAKQAILDFVKTTTDKSNPKFVPLEDRIATFDQDGTTWVEQPMYSQILFAFDRVAEMAPAASGVEDQDAIQSYRHRRQRGDGEVHHEGH